MKEDIMKFVPKAVSRTAGTALLKLNKNSPTILVVAGVVGLGATAVMAAKATTKLDPIIDEHVKARHEISLNTMTEKADQKQIVQLYRKTGFELTKLYGPTVFVGVTSAVAVLGGHKILRSRQIATMAAYSGLLEQFQAYRKRVALTLGEDVEKGIYEGAHGEWVENEKGEKELRPAFNPDNVAQYLRPWYDENNVNWSRDPVQNYLFLKGVQAHMNHRLQAKGHVFLNEVLDALGMPRVPEGQAAGWVWNNSAGDGWVDFGFLSSLDPNTQEFCAQKVRVPVQLNFNIDGIVWDKI